MRIGLLGNLIIFTRGESLRITAGRQRSVLAALATAPNDAVPADMLAEAVWDGAPPPSWAATIRNYVKRLRHLLRDDAGDRIITTAPGYMLRADRSEEVDLALFEAQCKSGYQAAGAGNWRQASVTLSLALDLWRGTPFSDIPSRYIRDTHVPYLEEMRLTALTTRIHADLQAHPSEAAILVPGLQQLSRQYPLREHFRAQLMQALYLAGRQADALAAYTQAREVSIAELGIEPGHDLKELQQRILAGDPSLRSPQPAVIMRPGTAGSPRR